MGPSERLKAKKRKINKKRQRLKNLEDEYETEGYEEFKKFVGDWIAYYLFASIISPIFTKYGFLAILFNVPLGLVLIVVEWYCDMKISTIKDDLPYVRRDIKEEINQLEVEAEVIEEQVEAILLKKENKHKKLEWWISMTPEEFEEEIAEYYRLQGAEAEKTPNSNDGGYDVMVKKNNTKILVECKKWSKNSKVSRPTVQKLGGVIEGEEADYGVFITTASFTDGAKEYAKKVGIELIDGEKLTSKNKEM